MDENQLKLLSGKIITFNTEQFDGLKKINHWLKNGQTFFTLTGPAGSGKSTIIKKVLDNYHRGVVVSAPTHKAVRVISNITNKEGQTLHSLIGLRPDVDISDFNPNSPIFNPIALPRINNYSLIIVDEASMINADLFKLIKEKTKNTKTKVLFLGDNCQIPPVNEKESVVFFQIDIEKHFLTKIERQEDTNPILLVADNVRNNLIAIHESFERKTNINDLGDGITFTTEKREFRKIILEKFMSNEFNKSIDYCRGVAWKNETVMRSNNVVRTSIFGKDSDIVEINDVVTGYRTIMDEKQRFVIIQNSGDYRIMEKCELEENAYGIMGYRVKIRETLINGKFKLQDIFIVNSKNHDNLHLYAQMHDFFRDLGISNKKMWKKYYEFRRCNILMETIDKYQNGQLRSSYNIIIKDIDYGYFLTCHKVQGSTYKHVGIILSDIESNWVLKEKNQLFYTSLTRPTSTATILCNRID